MRLTEKDTASITLTALAHNPKLNYAMELAVAMVELVAERDAKWIEYVKEKYNIEVDPTELNGDYIEARNRIKRY